MTPLALFDLNWTSNSYLLYFGLFVLAFVIVMLFRVLQQKQAETAGSPAGSSAPSLAPSANPKDVQDSLHALSNLANLEGFQEIAVALDHLANGDESEVHRSIREIAMRLRSPRAVTAMAKGVIIRHYAELKDDPEIKALVGA